MVLLPPNNWQAITLVAHISQLYSNNHSTDLFRFSSGQLFARGLSCVFTKTFDYMNTFVIQR
jgi:hypothetical protein